MQIEPKQLSTEEQLQNLDKITRKMNAQLRNDDLLYNKQASYATHLPLGISDPLTQDELRAMRVNQEQRNAPFMESQRVWEEEFARNHPITDSGIIPEVPVKPAPNLEMARYKIHVAQTMSETDYLKAQVELLHDKIVKMKPKIIKRKTNWFEILLNRAWQGVCSVFTSLYNFGNWINDKIHLKSTQI